MRNGVDLIHRQPGGIEARPQRIHRTTQAVPGEGDLLAQVEQAILSPPLQLGRAAVEPLTGNRVWQRSQDTIAARVGGGRQCDALIKGTDSADRRQCGHEAEPPISGRGSRFECVPLVGPLDGEIAGHLTLTPTAGRKESQTDVLVCPSELLPGVEYSGAVWKPRGPAIGPLVQGQANGRRGVEWLVASDRGRAKRLGVPAPEKQEQGQGIEQFYGVPPHRCRTSMCHWCVGRGEDREGDAHLLRARTRAEVLASRLALALTLDP